MAEVRDQKQDQQQDQFGCALRLVAGAVLMVGAFFVHGPWVLIAVPGVVVYLAGALRYCPTFMPMHDEAHRDEHPVKT
jgi:hypothetical protein